MSKRLGNAVDPFKTLKKYSADATRWYMITNSQPWDNLKFNELGIQEVQRKFLGPFLTPILFLVYMPILILLIFLKNIYQYKKETSLIGGFYLNLTV